MPETNLNCDVSVLHRDGETPADAAKRLSRLLDSELCHLADHEISVRINAAPILFRWDAPDGPVAVMAMGLDDAKSLIRAEYPGSNPEPALAASVGKDVRVLWTRQALGRIPAGYDDLYVYIPSKNEILHVSEGTGDSLLPEDEQDGYVDYVNFAIYELNGGIEEGDGGMVLFRQLVRDKFRCLGETLPDVFQEAYDGDVDWFIPLSSAIHPGPSVLS